MLPVYQDFILNTGETGGPVAEMLQSTGSDPSLARPYINPEDGNRAYVSVPTGKMTRNAKGRLEKEYKEVRIKDFVDDTGIALPVFNATSLRKEEWLELDKQVIGAARYRLRAWSDLQASSTYRVDAMRTMILEHETMSDPGIAVEDMDGLTEGKHDAPLNQLQGLPISIKHVDFWFSKRRLSISRNNPSTALDTRMGEAAGFRLGEAVEKQTIGMTTGPVYGGQSTQYSGYGRTSQIYGYINFPARLTKTNLTTPLGTNASSTLADVLAMRDQLRARKMYGPYMLYHTNDWDQFLDNDYILSGGNVATQTLRDRLRAIDGIMDVRRLDMFFGVAPQTNPYFASTTQTGTTGQQIYAGPGGDIDVTPKAYSLLMVQMNQQTARAVIGMDITTVQWESQGGQRLNFKVLCSYQPQLFADYYGNCGVLQATTS